jgi:hypothetical protein
VNVEHVKATIARGDRAADEARAAMAQVRDQINEAARLATVTHDSRHPHVQRGYDRLKQAHTEAEAVIALLSAAVKAAETYRRTLG